MGAREGAGAGGVDVGCGVSGGPGSAGWGTGATTGATAAAGAPGGVIARCAGGGAGVAAMGRSALRPIASPQAGQKWSPLPWIAAHRGHAAIPASRNTVIGCPLPRTRSSARSSASKSLNTESFAATSSSWRWPRRCISNTSPPRSRYASSRALRRKRTRLRIRPRSTKPVPRGSVWTSTPAGSVPVGSSAVPPTPAPSVGVSPVPAPRVGGPPVRVSPVTACPWPACPGSVTPLPAPPGPGA
jgi:hypothetical protein